MESAASTGYPAASEEVTAEEWRRYTDTVELARRSRAAVRALRRRRDPRAGTAFRHREHARLPRGHDVRVRLADGDRGAPPRPERLGRRRAASGGGRSDSTRWCPAHPVTSARVSAARSIISRRSRSRSTLAGDRPGGVPARHERALEEPWRHRRALGDREVQPAPPETTRGPRVAARRSDHRDDRRPRRWRSAARAPSPRSGRVAARRPPPRSSARAARRPPRQARPGRARGRNAHGTRRRARRTRPVPRAARSPRSGLAPRPAGRRRSRSVHQAAASWSNRDAASSNTLASSREPASIIAPCSVAMN